MSTGDYQGIAGDGCVIDAPLKIADADRAGIHRTYVSDIERGRRNPSVTVVERLAKPLGATAGNLLD